ncbi:unnamed protein product [Rotaria sp. Silwood1]|nr:unnamed protein product [Rotaria sp. Silwood1]CAF1429948.1 unnamed protein product [Rotaria sp. Silwood1]CAF3567195.1 unnamed protein product [Rotaria sp. Silwood1]CAF3576372.1 unnamed protein product [Rotaria sp. Silwood1]CAF5122532.1 unnamed protein product [Rotaria sp. Silwood1]
MLIVCKYAIKVSGIFVPQISQTIPRSNIPGVFQNEKFLNNLDGRLDKMTVALEKVMKIDLKENHYDEHLEGVELREIEYFLAKFDKYRTLGNLYRTISSDGIVRWVCVKHYRQLYNDKKLKSLRREFRSLGGSMCLDTATIVKKDEKNIDQLFDVIGRGLNLFRLKLIKCYLSKISFDYLLTIVND